MAAKRSSTVHGQVELAPGLWTPRWITDGASADSANPARPCVTTWRPEAGTWQLEQVRAAVDALCKRMGVAHIDLLHLHWRDYTDPAYLDVIAHLLHLRAQGQFDHLGVAHFDTDHLRLLLRHGVPVATSQVGMSLLDRRALVRMVELCQSNPVQLLACAPLAGGLLTDRWLDQLEPAEIPEAGRSGHAALVRAIGGWSALQCVLQALRRIADRHQVVIADVAMRWVMDQPGVAAVLIDDAMPIDDSTAWRKRLDGLSLNGDDRAQLQAVLDATLPPAGDCGAEHHAGAVASVTVPRGSTTTSAGVSRLRPQPSSQWVDRAGGSRALRTGSRVVVAGTNAMHGASMVVARGDAEAQAVFALDKIAASLHALGASLQHVVRTRVYLRDLNAASGVAAVHARVFAGVCPASTVLGVAQLTDDCEVEIEAEAELPAPPRAFISSGTAYEALAGYSRAVVEDDWVFVSGTVGVDPATGVWAFGAPAQAQRAIDTIEAALLRAGLALLDVVRVVVYLASRDDVLPVSEVIRERFGPARPANTTLCVPLALEECRVEIEVTARRRAKSG